MSSVRLLAYSLSETPDFPTLMFAMWTYNVKGLQGGKGV